MDEKFWMTVMSALVTECKKHGIGAEPLMQFSRDPRFKRP